MLDKIKTLEPTRLYTAILMLIFVVLMIVFHSLMLIWGILGIALIVGFYESYKLYCGLKAPLWALGLVILLWIGVYFYPNPLELVFFLAILLASYQSYTKKGQIKHFMPFLYPCVPFIFLYLLYTTYGINSIIWLLIVVALSDSAAYFGGKLFGGKIFTNSTFCKTSPNKTKEGVLIGISFASIFGTLGGLGVCDFTFSLFVSILVSFASVFGDLYESYLKRSAGVKDSGSIFPGHGGVLDRLDGYFFGGALMYILLEIFKGGF
ncbi:phosphatidate cytidylyltransferase [Helicobacter burdigaliensis]|uniref:phosphatidate cytidylyltransferase n=1 Tax=Helicobacter burdigaliensis TaxID=2315334 RepID=UPI000EF74124|nr:phosphatidate cytidylyltransferase [Helicobacter burdigaliensis]